MYKIAAFSLTQAFYLFSQLDKMTVASLKEGIKTYGIKSSGTKKAQLIEAIKLHFGV